MDKWQVIMKTKAKKPREKKLEVLGTFANVEAVAKHMAKVCPTLDFVSAKRMEDED